MKTQVLIILLGLCCVSARAQNCDKIVQKIEVAYSDGRLDEALTQIRALRACDVSEQGKKLADTWTEKVYKSVQAQKDLAQSSLTKANRLIRHFNFDDEKAAWAYKDGLFAVIDRNGNTLTDFMYENPEPFNNGVAIAGINNQYVFVNDRGEEVSERYDYVILTVWGGYLGGREWERDILGKNGRVVFDNYEFDKSLNLVKQGDKWGFIDRNAKIVILPQFEEAGSFYQGLAKVKINNSWGYIDETGKIIIPPQFEDAGDFYQGLAPIQVKDLWGYISKTGKIIIQPQFNGAENLIDGLAQVYVYAQDTIAKIDDEYILSPVSLENIKRGLIDSSGRTIIEPQFNLIMEFEGGIAKIKNEDKWGLINKNGHLIISPQFDGIIPFYNGLMFVKKDKIWSLIDTAGPHYWTF
jgi:hypothetical protein